MSMSACDRNSPTERSEEHTTALPIYPGQWEFVVRGIYYPRDQTTDPSSMMFHYRYVDERVRQEFPDREIGRAHDCSSDLSRPVGVRGARHLLSPRPDHRSFIDDVPLSLCR